MSYQLKKGSFVASYEIIGIIAKGGMGEVYLAYEKNLNRKVALKVVSQNIAKDAENIKRFQIEGRSLAQLNNPHVVTVYSLGEEAGLHYIAMEYVEGKALDERIKESTFDIDQAIPVFFQMLDGLSALHKQGIIHRDLKPKNIIYGNNHKIKIVDFGIAKMVESQEMELTQMGVIVGSPRYLAPEVAKGKPAVFQSDLWGLGIIFYEMFEGKCPFNGKTHLEVLEQIKNKNFSFSKKVAKKIPFEIQDFVFQLCNRSLDQRFSNSEEAAQALNNILQSNTALNNHMSDSFFDKSHGSASLNSSFRSTVGQTNEDLEKTKMETGTFYHSNNNDTQGSSQNSWSSGASQTGTPEYQRHIQQSQGIRQFNTGSQKWGEGPVISYARKRKKSKAGNKNIFAIAGIALLALSLFIVLSPDKKEPPLPVATAPNQLDIPEPTAVLKPPPVPSVDLSIPTVKVAVKKLEELPPVENFNDSALLSEPLAQPIITKKKVVTKSRIKSSRAPVARPQFLTKVQNVSLDFGSINGRNISSTGAPLNPPKLRWTKTPRASYYQIQISKDKGFSQPLDYTSESNSFTWTEAQAGRHYVRVRAVGENARIGKFSNLGQVIITTKPPGLKSEFQKIIKVKTWQEYKKTKVPITINWSQIPIASKYHMIVSSTKSFSRNTISKFVTGTSHEIKLEKNKTYYIKVAAINENNRKISSYSSPAKIKAIKSLDLNSPVIISPRSGTALVSYKNSPQIFNWQRSKYAKSYKIEFSKNKQFKRIIKSFVSDSTNLVARYKFPKGTIYWRIQATHDKNKSSWSSPSYFVIP
ncbi:MAG: protein kinase [Bdellovibrionaceae bacterium]|jgi:serine/threonine protein kinase|nr:protein kinase [Pseudobdellovibrionaceae bacterium]